MCLFMPHFSHHNNITVDEEDDIVPFRPVIPCIAGRLLIVAPSFSHHNNIRVAKHTTGEIIGKHGAQREPCLECRLDDRHIVKFCEFCASQAQQGGAALAEPREDKVGEKQQMRLFEKGILEEKLRHMNLDKPNDKLALAKKL